MRLVVMVAVCASCSSGDRPRTEQPRDPNLLLFYGGKLHVETDDRFTCSSTRVAAETCKRRDPTAECVPVPPPGHWSYGGCGGARVDEQKIEHELATKTVPACVCSCDQDVADAKAREALRARQCAQAP